MDRWRFWVEREAKSVAPFWRGHLRRTITSEVDHGAIPAWARVGTNDPKGVFVHEGTRPHWPPLAAITPWAVSKGIAPFLVARAIAEHGTEARPFLADPLHASEAKVTGWLGQMASEIESAAASGGS